MYIPASFAKGSQNFKKYRLKAELAYTEFDRSKKNHGPEPESYPEVNYHVKCPKISQQLRTEQIKAAYQLNFTI